MVYYSNYLSHGKDGLNNMKKRNIKNTPKDVYNCGGYALKTFSWYVPTHKYNGRVGSRTTSNGPCVEVMLEDFPDLRLIHSLDEVGADEYAIAFRLSPNDFHYAWRAKNGRWFHKMGGKPYIETMSEKEVFSENWLGRYDGEIVLFAKRL